MFTVWGKKQSFCDGVSRRDFLRIGAFGAGLTLADMLRAKASAAPGQASPRLKSAIMIYLPGGPTHMDTYDLKPDAPVEFRGELRPIQTNVPGVQICELFPLQAQMWDKLACIRSLVTVNEHSDSMVMTGHRTAELMTGNYPSFGSVVSRLRSHLPQGGPAFVSLRGTTRGTEPGYLGIQHRPFTPTGAALANLQPVAQVDAGRLDDRRAMLDVFDGIQRDLDVNGTLSGLDRFTQQAFEMVASGGVRQALDLTAERADVRNRYRGVEDFLRARRLVEQGVGCVTLRFGSWDTHSNNFRSMRTQLPVLDRGIANLIQDLHERGLANDVVTIVWGEFGRTPRINRNAGRDHWPAVMSAMIAGGGLRMGQAVGASSARGETPVSVRCTPARVLSTIYRAIGIDPAQTIADNTGRPRHIMDDREPIRELL